MRWDGACSRTRLSRAARASHRPPRAERGGLVMRHGAGAAHARSDRPEPRRVRSSCSARRTISPRTTSSETWQPLHREQPRGDWLAAIAQQQDARASCWPFRMVYDTVVWIKRGITGWPRAASEPSHVSGRGSGRALCQRADACLADEDLQPRFRSSSWTSMRTQPSSTPSIRAAPRGVLSPCIRSLRVVDLSQRLTPAMHYVLDDHLNARGHQAIADALIGIVDR